MNVHWIFVKCFPCSYWYERVFFVVVVVFPSFVSWCDGLYWVFKCWTCIPGIHLTWLFSSVQFSYSVMSDSLQPHGLQHARLPCPSPTPGACSNLCPSSCWCYPTTSSSIIPFSFCLQSFPVSGSFLMSQFFASSSQSIGVSDSTSVLPMNIQVWFPLGWTDWTSLQSKGLSRAFNTAVQKHQFFGTQLLFIHCWIQFASILLRTFVYSSWDISICSFALF